MTQIAWKDTYSVGVALIDRQHRELLEFLNEISAQEDMAPDEFFPALNKLVRYAEEHFQTEESLMARHGYPDREAQEAEHTAFVAKVFALQEELQKGDPALCRHIVGFIKDWYIEHVLGTDKKYAPFFREKGVS